MTGRLAAILGCAGEELAEGERALFRETRPVGLILFARNCRSPAQVRRLTDSWRDAVGTDDCLVLIDQEGGRVCRLGPPHWRAPPAAAEFGRLAAEDGDLAAALVRLNARLIAADLRPLGINVDCIPVLDAPAPGADDVIGDRAFAADPGVVAALGRAACDGLAAGGVLPVVKHVPGHGRAAVDSHQALPVVAADRAALDGHDFAPFRALSDAPLAMTAHVVFTAVDEDRPATISPGAVGLIRGDIGFDGLLMTDDLSMKALAGVPGGGGARDRARAARMAGCDVVLHCNGDAGEMAAVAEGAGPLDAAGRRRLDAALGWPRAPEPLDAAAAVARIDEALNRAGRGGWR